MGGHRPSTDDHSTTFRCFPDLLGGLEFFGMHEFFIGPNSSNDYGGRGGRA